MKKLLLLSILISLSTLTSCVKKGCDFSGPHQFQIPVNLSPAKDTFRIGDTINISSTFSEEVFELKTQRAYTLDDFKFFPETRITKWETHPDSIIIDNTALPNFEVLIDTIYDYEHFYFSFGEVSLTGQYKHQNGFYDLKYQLIPQKEGLYWFGQSSCLFALGDDQDFSGKCRNHDVDGHVRLNEGADNNVDFIKYNPDGSTSVFWERQDEKFHVFGGYCFYVVE